MTVNRVQVMGERFEMKNLISENWSGAEKKTKERKNHYYEECEQNQMGALVV